MDEKLFKHLCTSIKQGGRILRGESKAGRVTEIKPRKAKALKPPTIRKMRERSGLSQIEFARLLHVNLRTLQNWEQERAKPSGAAEALLVILAKEPEAAIRALHS